MLFFKLSETAENMFDNHWHIVDLAFIDPSMKMQCCAKVQTFRLFSVRVGQFLMDDSRLFPDP